jgi:hypothetical protein
MTKDALPLSAYVERGPGGEEKRTERGPDRLPLLSNRNFRVASANP